MKTPVDDYLSQLRRIESTRIRVETAFGTGHLFLTDIESVYEALFLRSVVGFEGMLEELFCRIVLGKIKYARNRVSVRVNFKTAANFYEIVWSKKGFLDWLPYNQTADRAKLFLNSGRPFTELSQSEMGRLGQIVAIRNAVAHRSEHAMNQFKRQVINTQVLPPREKKPAGYLRSLYRSNPDTTRFQDFAGHLALISKKLAP